MIKKLPFCFIAGMSVISLATSVAMAAPMVTSPMGSVYLGAFGGWGGSNDFDVRQSGVAFFTTPPLLTPLPVDATGDDDSFGTGFGGIHLGYEWITPRYKDTLWTWAVVPAIEVEGVYFDQNTSLDVVNANPRLGNHTFDDSFSLQTGVVLINGILSFNHINSAFHPYIGLGLGAAILSVSGADSLQIAPPEPGVNHFNSGTSDDDWTFAAQVKAGLRYSISEHVRVFAEYRFLYLGNTNYTFGATRYPTHVETTSWELDMDSMNLNAGALGIEWSI